MITASHFVYTWALAKATNAQNSSRRVSYFLVGALLPDSVTYVFFVYHQLFTTVSQAELWRVLYFSSAWTPYITASHSFLLWGVVFFSGVLLGKDALRWVGGSALIHSAFDFFVHHADAYAHFWPLSDWRFMSPISYYDERYYGDIFSVVDTVVVLALLGWLHQRYPNRKVRIGIYVLGILYGLLLFTPILSVLFS